MVESINWKQEMCALVSADQNLEQLHEFGNLPWNPSLHPIWQGKVGFVIRRENDGVWMKFFDWESPRTPLKRTTLGEIDIQFHVRALYPVKNLHFMDGDRAALGKLIRGRRQFQMVSVRVLSENEKKFSLKIGKAPAFEWSPFHFPSDILLPIYFGRARQYLLREKIYDKPCVVDASASRILYGILQCQPGMEVIHSLLTWDQHDGGLFRWALRCNPHQVNQKINGKTPMMVAIEEGNWAAIVILIAFGAQREAIDENLNTLLHLASIQGNVCVLEGLLGFIERDINKVNLQGDTALHLATRGLNAGCVDRLLCVPKIHASFSNNFGETVLHVISAIPENTTSLTILSRILGNQRLNPNLANNNGWTALHIAIMRGNSKCVESMIMSRPNLLSSNMPPPLVFAAMHGKNKVVDIILTLKHDYAVELQTLPDGRTAIHMAVESWQGDVDSDLARLACVQSLVTAGTPLTFVDNKGQTACHLLVEFMNKNPKMLDRIVLNNAIHCQKATMKLDEMAAKLKPHWQLACLCFLATRGCDLLTVDRKGISPIDLCADEKLKDTLQLFVSNRLKCCLPMAVPADEFDTSDVHMCTFNCEDSVADVEFLPCHHRVMCKKCAAMAPHRRCPMCYTSIASAVDLQGDPIEMGSALKAKEKDDQEFEMKAKEAAKRAKEEAEIEKTKEIEKLKEALEKLEMEVSCAICMDARPSVVFNCGHTCCGVCAEAIKLCHICRKPIVQKMALYT